MANIIGEKELKTDWPIEEGLTAKTQTQTGRTSNLIPEGINSIKTTVPERDRELM